MIFSLIITILSEFIPESHPKYMNKCPKKIDNILTYLQPEQYCNCIYKNSKVSIGTSIKKIPKYAFYGAEIKEVHLHPDIMIDCLQAIQILILCINQILLLHPFLFQI